MRPEPSRLLEEGRIAIAQQAGDGRESVVAVLEDGGRAELMTALRYVTEAFGGVSAVAQKTGLNTTTLYRTLSPRGNPELKSFMDIMKAVGMRILVEPTPARR